MQQIAPIKPKYHLQPVVDPSEDYEAIIARQQSLLAVDVSNRLKAANVPQRLMTASLDNYRTMSTEQELVLRKVRDFASAYQPKDGIPPRCLLMYGQTGTGKTHLAVAVMRDPLHDRERHRTGCPLDIPQGIERNRS